MVAKKFYFVLYLMKFIEYVIHILLEKHGANVHEYMKANLSEPYMNEYMKANLVSP